MRIIFFFICVISPLYAHIYDTTVLYAIGEQGVRRRIILFHDYHSRGPVNKQQFKEIKELLTDRLAQDSSPLSILIEQQAAFDAYARNDLILAKLTKLHKKKTNAAQLNIWPENIEIRAAALAAAWLLENNELAVTCDRINEFKLVYDDRDNAYDPLELKFRDIFPAFEVRARQIVSKADQLDIEFKYIEQNLQEAYALIDGVKRCLLRENIAYDAHIADVSRKLAAADSNNLRIALSDTICYAFNPLFELYAALRIKELSYDSNVASFTGGLHAWRVASLLQRWEEAYQIKESEVDIYKIGELELSKQKEELKTLIKPLSKESLDLFCRDLTSSESLGVMRWLSEALDCFISG